MDASQALTLIPRVLIRLYQTVGRGRPRRCRFYPSCSDYAYQALEAEGLGRGLSLTIRRLLKCHPWHPGGFDPILHSRHCIVGGSAEDVVAERR